MNYTVTTLNEEKESREVLLKYLKKCYSERRKDIYNEGCRIYYYDLNKL